MLTFLISILCVNAVSSGGSEEEACMKALQAFSMQTGIYEELRSIEKDVEKKARKHIKDERVWTAAGIVYVFAKKKEIIHSFNADPYMDSVGLRIKMKAKQNGGFVTFRWDF